MEDGEGASTAIAESNKECKTELQSDIDNGIDVEEDYQGIEIVFCDMGDRDTESTSEHEIERL